ncbi:MAG: thermonuclease family protein [Planctomycetes bacterium]|nr:thermonuclease family protein [Planctomycetota bacterium]MBI3844103.1 thermonuclease family protein [Planctomycetota bacterium]
MNRSGIVALTLSVAALVVALFIVRPKTWPSTDEVSPANTSQAAPVPRSSFEAVATRVVDGDTVRLSDGRELRYIGIDCAEKGEPYAEEAKARNRTLVEGKHLRIETDEETTDRYGRVLGYAYVEGSKKSVNEMLVEDGLALYFLVPPNKALAAQLFAAQGRARERHRGTWSQKVPNVEPYYVGSSDRFHRPNCTHVKDIQHPTQFPTREAALDAGRSPCRTCKP